jgi:aspartyl-tRNA(Asn)/glutamyl-tRNA(Gln) amidotransferase subunit B
MTHASEQRGDGQTRIDHTTAVIERVEVIVGMEVHVELSCGTKVFSRALSPAGAQVTREPEPNTCLDPVVLGLPGALPVVNMAAVEMSIAVGLALRCNIAPVTRWDRKSYFYADMPKGYQISQYDLPLCFDGSMDVPAPAAEQRGGEVAIDESLPAKRVGIIRAHLEEDAGKLMHDAPGGGVIDHSIVDLNRAGTALLEIVTQPDFRSAEEVVIFCKQLRGVCRALGVTQGVMQKGHMRFEPNINCVLHLAGGRVIRTPIVEVKNLNSFKAVRQAIECEAREQPGRWQRDGKVFGPGSKTTRGWDDARGVTVLQREKEDAHDYRYFPDPDLLPIVIERAMVERIGASLAELPHQARARYRTAFDFGAKEAAALSDEPETMRLMNEAVEVAVGLGMPLPRAGKMVGNLILNTLFRMVGEAGGGGGGEGEDEREQTQAGTAADLGVTGLGITGLGLASVAVLRDRGDISAQGADALLVEVRTMAAEHQTMALIEACAQRRGMIRVRDSAAMEAWVRGAIESQPQAAADVRAGKDAAIGRLVGAAMKLAGGAGDAAELRAMLIKMLRS